MEKAILKPPEVGENEIMFSNPTSNQPLHKQS